jgi:hypothetical protein
MLIRAHPDNTGDAFVGNDGSGDVSAANGLPLKATDPPVALRARPHEVFVDVEVNGEKVCWLLHSID